MSINFPSTDIRVDLLLTITRAPLNYQSVCIIITAFASIRCEVYTLHRLRVLAYMMHMGNLFQSALGGVMGGLSTRYRPGFSIGQSARCQFPNVSQV